MIKGVLRVTGEGPAHTDAFDTALRQIEIPGGTLAVAEGVSVHAENGLVCIALGAPRFRDAALSDLSARKGVAAAWMDAFRESGAQSAQRAAGRFAVVLLDTTRRLAWLAVDRFASIPLCHRLERGTLAFSDRADRVPLSKKRLRDQSVFDYLYFHNIPAPQTIFEDVSRVQAGHGVLVENAQVSALPYWTPRFEEPRTGDLDSLKREFLELVFQSVEREAAGQSVGAFLSGGTDSSTVSGMLCRALGAPARTYSIGFDASGYDEMKYARIAARHFGTDHHEYYVTPEDLVEGIPKVAVSFDQPFGNSSAVPAWICARMAKADGVNRMLAGDGGDELFGGNSRYAKQRIFGWYDAIPIPLRKRVVEPVMAIRRLERVPLVKKGVSYIEQARVPMPDRVQMYNLLLRLGTAHILTPDFLAQVDQEHPLRMQRETWQGIQGGTLINRMLAFDWKYTLADNDLPKVVGATHLAGVNVGFPLLSDELLEFSLKLPPEWKLKGLSLRWFFKEALRGFLPAEIIAKKKHGFGLPFGIWMVEHPELETMAAEALRSFAKREVIRAEFIARLMKDLLPAHPGYYGELVWVIMMMEYWFQRPDR